MKRNKPLTRKTPLRGNPQKTREWKDRSRQSLPARSTTRRAQETTYGKLHKEFLAKHPICPVMGTRATEIHHTARRVGGWLNIQRYWVALSREAHEWVEENGAEAKKYGLLYSFNPSLTAEKHLQLLEATGIDTDVPVFYEDYNDESAMLELRSKIQGRRS